MRVVGGQWKGHSLEAPKDAAITRPTTDRVREAMASMLLSSFGLDLHECRVLDAFAGTGAIGIELLSRGAAHACFVDKDARALERVRRNLLSLGEQGTRSQLMSGDVFTLAERSLLPGPFDIVVLDPPYALPASQLESFIGKLVTHELVGLHTCIVYERESSASTLEGETAAMIKSKKYGNTTVELLRPVL